MRFGVDGRVARLRVRDSAQPGIHVARGATATTRATALAEARYGSRAGAALLEAARARRWRALGGSVTLEDTATLAWRVTDGTRERALWQVRATLAVNGQPANYFVTLDPRDGSLIELVREDGAR